MIKNHLPAFMQVFNRTRAKAAHHITTCSIAFRFAGMVVAAMCFSRNMVWCWAADFPANRFKGCMIRQTDPVDYEYGEKIINTINQ
jgi:hypothetical protein